MGKALDAEERLHVCFKMIASMMSEKHFKCDLFHFRDLFKIRCNSLRCVIVFVVRKQLLWHYFNELSIFVVYRVLMQKNWLVRTNQTITFIPMLIVLFIGIVGYEWLRTELVGIWVLLIAFILLGRFLNLIQAMIVSIFIFIFCFFYILFDF